MTPTDAQDDALTLSLKNAAELAGVSRATIRRKRSELVKHGARITGQGRWEVPVSALVALGMVPNSPSPDTPAVRQSVRHDAQDDAQRDAHGDARPDAHVTPTDAQFSELQERVRELEHRLELQEAEAQHERATLNAELEHNRQLSNRELERERAVSREKDRVIEAVQATVREKERVIEVQQLALRALGPGPQPHHETQPAPEPPTPGPETLRLTEPPNQPIQHTAEAMDAGPASRTRKRHWWQRH